ncbi:MAG: outer membrane protein assembly factor BamE [Gammaproteobacteria bacterium]
MKTLAAGLAALALLTLSACSRATPDNYAKLEPGMTREQVYDILGDPDDVSGGGIGRLTLSTETWTGPKHVISVTFAGDQMTIKRIEPRGRE